MITENDFHYKSSSKVEINDGCIKCIYIECSDKNEFDNENCLPLSDGGSAVIYFKNGKKLLITNSEWCSLNWV